jgi:hypothetical protein
MIVTSLKNAGKEGIIAIERSALDAKKRNSNVPHSCRAHDSV